MKAESVLVEEIQAQTLALALRCAPGVSEHVRVTSVADPEMPNRFTLIVEEVAGDHSELMLVDMDSDHVLEAQAGAIGEGVRRAAKTLYIGPHLFGPLREALARVG